jgi:hypothetical protein
MRFDTDLKAAIYGHKKELYETALVVVATLATTGAVFALADAIAGPSCPAPREIISLIREPAPIAADGWTWPIAERIDRPADETAETAADENTPRRRGHHGRRG